MAAALVAAGWGFGAWRLAQPVPARAEPLVVRLVQPNARQELKWQPGMEQEFYDRHIALTRAPADPRPGRDDLVGDGRALRARASGRTCRPRRRPRRRRGG